MQKTKTAVIMLMILMVVVILGFALILTRKQTITIGGETATLKSSWKKTDAPEDKPAATTKTA